ncbi:MAG: HvfB family MNIO-type RiPP peptide maturase [Lutibacter sp.]
MVGIGYRKDFVEEFAANKDFNPDFLEVAPENWMNVGGYYQKMFKKALEKYPLFAHGLSLSVGSPEGVDVDFVKNVKQFLETYNVVTYSEHLSFSKCENAHLFDLLPIPFTEEAVNHVAQNIRQVQDILERRIAIEIVSYYSPVAPEMTELEFINAILREADCDLLLDVNNIYVNGFNHGYNPKSFIEKLDVSHVKYIHMAGHTKVAKDLIIDTHGENIIDPVYELFDFTMRKLRNDVPVLLERDFNIPELEILQKEMGQLRSIKKEALNSVNYAIK